MSDYAIPSALRVSPMVLADSDMKRVVVEVYPSSANASTKFSELDSLLFTLPAYKKSFIDFSRSYIKYTAKVTNSATSSNGTCRFMDNMPWIERLQVRAGSTMLEDIQGYATLEKMMMTLKSKTELANERKNGNYTVSDASVTTAIILTEQTEGVSYVKKLMGGVFSNEAYLFPINRLSGGLEVEINIGNKSSILKGVTRSDNSYSASTFELTNVKFVLSLLQVSDDFTSKYDKMTNNNELVLPVTSYQRSLSTYAALTREPVVFIPSSKKDVKRCYTSFTKNLNTITNVITATPDLHKHQPELLKGTTDGQQRLQRFRHVYNDINYPDNHVDAFFNTTTARVTDQNQMIEHVLNNIDVKIKDKQPYFSTSDVYGGKIRCVYEDGLIIVQDFKSSDDDYINGLNMNNNSPLILELKFDDQDVSSTNINTYLEISSEIVIKSDGHVSIVTKSAK
jgi:hypothetical protein